jgi:hypothetical protein
MLSLLELDTLVASDPLIKDNAEWSDIPGALEDEDEEDDDE